MFLKRYAKTFNRLGLKGPRGVLLHGPPGCSKTTIARAIANSAKSSFFTISGADVYSPFVGDAEKNVREIFSRARSAQPSIIFLDEVDALVGKREMGSGESSHGSSSVQSRILSTLLNEMDGVNVSDHILILGATNRIHLIDSALLRPGRFDVVIDIPKPDHKAREAILR